MCPYDLTDRVAIVTGGSSGIGRGIAEGLARDGATIVVADIRENPRTGEHAVDARPATTANLVAEDHGVESLFVHTDTGDADAVASLVETTVERFGRLDILVNNAGIIIPGTSQDVSVGEYTHAIDVNLNGYFFAAKFAIPHLRRSDQGRVINISSVNARYGGGGAAYAASKAGIVNMTRDLALEVADAGVTVNAILPGAINTALQDVGGEDAIARRRERTPLGRLGDPKDVAHAVRFLVSNEAAWITGADLLVDGGYLAGRP